MANKVPESSSPAQQGEAGAVPAPQPGQPEHQRSRSGTTFTVSKSGPLFLSSKGIGWTTWKKRWFVLSGNSLVFYRSDPNAAGQKNPETNLPLGGIDLNSSGSVEVKPDKKLLNVVFPDGRDGRAFTLKAETSEDLHEWKTALEAALAQAPSPASMAGQNGVLNGEQAESNGSSEQQKDKPPAKSLIVGRPVLLALEDIDGSPSFLEKALQFIEEHGYKTEGILRQAADAELVERRIYDYEHGKTEFSPDEDAHVIGDCVKYILRELPSSPVPASCCKALLEAYKSDRSRRVKAMRIAILETFPEPNRKLLQRCLVMVQNVIAHKDLNRMGTSAAAACMSPLLLRPLLAGDCEVENQQMDVAGDNSLQLLQAAAAANHAQAIVIMLLDDYDQIFGEGPLSPEVFSDEEDEESGSEEGSEYEDDDEIYEDEDEDDDEDDGYESEDPDEDEEYGSDEEEEETDDDNEPSGSESCSDTGDKKASNPDDQKSTGGPAPAGKPQESSDNEGNFQKSQSLEGDSDASGPKPATTVSESSESLQHPRWRRAPAKKMEEAEFSEEDEGEAKNLEASKKQLEQQVAEEAKGNEAALLQQKIALHKRRLALEKDVDRLQEQLQNERDLRAALSRGLSISEIHVSAKINERVKKEITEIVAEEKSINSLKEKVHDLGMRLNEQQEKNYSIMRDRGIKPRGASNQAKPLVDDQKENEDDDKSKNHDKEDESEERRTQQANEPETMDQDRDSSQSPQGQTPDPNIGLNQEHGSQPQQPEGGSPPKETHTR